MTIKTLLRNHRSSGTFYDHQVPRKFLMAYQIGLITTSKIISREVPAQPCLSLQFFQEGLIDPFPSECVELSFQSLPIVLTSETFLSAAKLRYLSLIHLVST